MNWRPVQVVVCSDAVLATMLASSPVHFLSRDDKPLCGSDEQQALASTDFARVTCLKCRKLVQS